MKPESQYEYSARIFRNDYLKRAVIALLIALPFIVEAVVIYANAKTEEDIWGGLSPSSLSEWCGLSRLSSTSRVLTLGTGSVPNALKPLTNGFNSNSYSRITT